MTQRPFTALFFVASIALLSFVLMSRNAMSEQQKQPATLRQPTTNERTITLGAGCFWCVEAVFNRIEGVRTATSGYMGGQREDPTYEDVTSRNSGEVEVVHIIYDPNVISLSSILDYFWQLHDPTQANGQGNDIGPQYLSRIFTSAKDDVAIAKKSLAKAQMKFSKPIATKILPATTFYPAEQYHQNYYTQNRSKNPYCPAVITPKMKKLGLDNKPDITEE